MPTPTPTDTGGGGDTPTTGGPGGGGQTPGTGGSGGGSGGQDQASNLPRTGGIALGTVLVGLLLVGSGTWLRRIARERRH